MQLVFAVRWSERVFRLVICGLVQRDAIFGGMEIWSPLQAFCEAASIDCLFGKRFNADSIDSVFMREANVNSRLPIFGGEADEVAGASCASILKVLADDTRLAVIELLLNHSMNVSEMNESLQVEQSLLSHHLKVLRDAGLVISERHGKHLCYSLAPSVKGSRRGRAINLGCCLISFE